MNKLITLLLSAVLLSIQGFGQAKDSVYTWTKAMPEAGFDINQYLSANMQYPPDAREAGIVGRVVTKFVITETGDIDSICIMKPIHPLLAAEAVRVIKEMPHWKPGTNEKGEPVKVFFTLPIKFTLEGVPIKQPQRYNQYQGQYTLNLMLCLCLLITCLTFSESMHGYRRMCNLQA